MNFVPTVRCTGAFVRGLVLAGLGWGLSASLSASTWQLGPCGRGGLCPGQYTPLPTPTETATPDPSAPTPTPWPSATVTPTAEPNAFQLRVQVGASAALSAANGESWQVDQAWDGHWGFDDSSPAYVSAATPLGTDDPALYQSLRMGSSLAYRVDLPNGNYRVTLHFIEWTASQAGERVMDVTAEGALQDDDLDLFALAGNGRALSRSYSVTVSDGVLDLALSASQGKAVLAGLAVDALQATTPTPTPSPTVTPTEPPLLLRLDLPANARLIPAP